MLQLLLDNQENLLVLISAFIIGGVFKTRGLFLPVFALLTNKIRSKRIGLLLISLVAGILPVEGRVSISAPVLDSLVPPENNKDICCAGHNPRTKMGVLDFIANHHYYLWSPLEKTVILPMAVLGLTYAQLLSYTLLPLLVYFGYLAWLVFNYVSEDDIEVTPATVSWSVWTLFNILPFLVGIVLSIVFDPVMVFPVVAIVYAVVNRVSVKEALSFIKWQPLVFVALVIVLGNYVNSHAVVITNAFQMSHIPSKSITGAIVVASALGAGLAALLLGSSGKYAALAVVLTPILGIQYLPVVLMAEFAGYLLSPTHKCWAISASYFKTTTAQFYRYVGVLAALMVLSGSAVLYLH